jgi:hypothetical protein
MQAAIGQPGGGGGALLFLTLSAIRFPVLLTGRLADSFANVKLYAIQK